jgi:hypothetical protein
MATSLDKIRAMIKGNKNTNKWSPLPGNHTIRIVPSKLDPENPFTLLKLYYGINGKTLLSPTTVGDPDPIYELARKLYDAKTEESEAAAKKITPKPRFFLPIIVREEENKGVMLWGVSKTMKDDLAKIIEQNLIEDDTDIVDPVSGIDLIVEVLSPKDAGNKFGKTTVRAKKKSTALSTDKELVEKWLTDQPDPNSLYEMPSYDDLKKELEKYLNSGSEVDTVGAKVEVDDEDEVSETKVQTLKKTGDANAKIDELFGKEN